MGRLRAALALVVLLGAGGCAGVDRRPATTPRAGRPVVGPRATVAARSRMVPSVARPEPRTNRTHESVARFFPGLDRTSRAPARPVPTQAELLARAPASRPSPTPAIEPDLDPPVLPVGLEVEVHPDNIAPGELSAVETGPPGDQPPSLVEVEAVPDLVEAPGDVPDAPPPLIESGAPAPVVADPALAGRPRMPLSRPSPWLPDLPPVMFPPSYHRVAVMPPAPTEEPRRWRPRLLERWRQTRAERSGRREVAPGR